MRSEIGVDCPTAPPAEAGCGWVGRQVWRSAAICLESFTHSTLCTTLDHTRSCCQLVHTRSCLHTRHIAPSCWHIAREQGNGNRNIIFFNKLQHGWCVVRLGLLLLVSNSAKLISIWMKENIYFLWRRQYFHHLLFPHFYVEVQWKSSLISSGQWSLCCKRE